MGYQLYYDLKPILSQSEIDAIDEGTSTFRSNGLYVFDPTPLITMNDSWQRQANEDKILRNTQLTIHGSLVSVNPSGVDPNGQSLNPSLEDMYKRRDLLANVFSYNRGDLVLETDTGQNIFTFQPIIESVEFEEAVWVNRIDYTINAAAQSEEDSQRISSGSDEINVSYNPESDTIEVQRTINATGIVYRYGSNPDDKLEAIENAKVWVLSRLNGADISSITNRSDYDDFIAQFKNTPVGSSALWNAANVPDTIFPDAAYTNVVANSFTESSNSFDGTYQVTLTYVKSKKLATVETSFDTSHDATNQTDTVTINGTITGLGIDGPTRYANAVSVYNDIIGNSNLDSSEISIPTDTFNTPIDLTSYDDSNSMSDWSLPNTLTNLNLQSWSRAIDEKRGIINFSFVYNNTASVYADKYVVDQFSFNVTNRSRKIASIDIPFRQAGPVIQDLKTTNSKEISMNATGVVLKVDRNGNTVEFQPDDSMFNDIITSLFNSGLFSSSFQSSLISDLLINVSDTSNMGSSLSTTTLTADATSFDPIKRTFSIQKTWVYNT